MEHDIVAPVLSCRHERLATPGDAAVEGGVQATKVIALCHFAEPDAAHEEMPAVERVNGDGTNAAGQVCAIARCMEPPGLPAVVRTIEADARIRVGGQVRLSSAAVQDLRVRGVDGQSPDVQDVLVVPLRLPCVAGIRAVPDPSSRGAGPDAMGLR